MDIFQAIILALLQGLTEFLPISSSAHLILLPVLVGWKDQELAFDVAVHVGTLTAVVVFYVKDFLKTNTQHGYFINSKEQINNTKIIFLIIFGTIPVGLVGISLTETTIHILRSPLLIAGSTFIFALLLWLVQKLSKENRTKITLNDAVIVGLFQVVALIPGVSRSGITITAGLLVGLKLQQATHFSFLLSIPVIALAGLLKGNELYQAAEPVMWDLILIGACVSALTAYLSIGWFLKVLEKVGILPFVIYRLLLSGLLFIIFLD